MLPPSLLALRIIFFAVLALAASASASSEVDRCWMDAWYSPPLETIWKLHWGLPSDEPEWEFKDPAFLYLTFDEIGPMTFLHPTKNRSGAQETSFMLGDRAERTSVRIPDRTCVFSRLRGKLSADRSNHWSAPSIEGKCSVLF